MEKIFRPLIISLFVIIGLAFIPGCVFAHQPRIIYYKTGDINIESPELSQAFYDELKGQPREYFIDSKNDFILYLNILVPYPENKDGRYSVNVFDDKDKKIYSIDGKLFVWNEYYEEFGRDYYLKGPELTQKVLSGKYRIEVFSDSLPAQTANKGKYVLAIGKTESFDAMSVINIYWQLFLLKLTFFKSSVLQFFLTPFGIGLAGLIGLIAILWATVNYIIGVIREAIKHNEAKTLFLASSFPEMTDEIIKLLQKPAYDVTVGFITTASNQEENTEYMQRDLELMNQIGFNVEQIDIAGKKEYELLKALELKDIIFVEGGNTFYLLKMMRACNFEKVLRKLLKRGIVYIGVSAGSMVVGKTIITSVWRGEFKGVNKNKVGLKNLRGLGLVPFDIFVHYTPEYDEIIRQKIKNPEKRAKNLKILPDYQAILVQGSDVSLIGDGEAIIV